MKNRIPIISNSMDSETLLAALKERNAQENILSFEVAQNDDTLPISTRSLDPTIVVAMIGLAGTTVTSLVTLIVALYKNKDKEGVVEIKVGDNALKYTGELTEEKKKEIWEIYNKLDEHNRTITIPLPLPEESENDYNEVLDQLLLEKVEHVKILEE